MTRPLFVLRSARHTRPRWFRAMTIWGPAMTDRLRDARRFPSRRAAEQHPAYDMPGTTFFIDEV